MPDGSIARVLALPGYGVFVDEDNYSAALQGWLIGALPLLDVKAESPHDTKHEETLRVYHAVVAAERARARGDHDAMVEQRRLLKQLAPSIFPAYMARL